MRRIVPLEDLDVGPAIYVIDCRGWKTGQSEQPILHHAAYRIALVDEGTDHDSISNMGFEDVIFEGASEAEWNQRLKLAESRHSQGEKRSPFENAHPLFPNQGVFWVDYEAQRLSFDSYSAQLLGIASENADFTLDAFLDRIGESQVESVRQQLAECATTGEPRELECRYARPQSSRLTIRLDVERSDAHEGISLKVVVQDITRETFLLEALESETSLFRILADHSPDVIFLMNVPERRSIYVNVRPSEYLGYEPDAFRDLSYEEMRKLIVHPDDLEKREERFAALEKLKRGEVFHQHCRLRRADGKYRHFHTRDVVVSMGKDGKPLHIISIGNDVTELTYANMKLETSESRFEETIQHLPVGVMIVNEDYDIVTANAALLKLFGWEASSAIGSAIKCDDIICCDEDGKLLEAGERPIDVVLENRRPVRNYVLGVRRNLADEPRWLLVSAEELSASEKREAILTFIDITDRKRASQALFNSQRQLQAASDIARLGSWTINLDTQDLDISEEFNRMAREWGFEGRSAMTLEEFMQTYMHPEDHPMVVGELQAALHNRSNQDYRSFFEYRLIDTKGEIHNMAVTVLWISEGIMGGVVQDLTDRSRLEARLRESHKLEALGSLAGGIAHDFRNIIAPILGQAELALHSDKVQAKERERFQVIADNALRARDLVGQILQFTRNKPSQIASVDMAKLVNEVAALIGEVMPSDIKIHLQRECENPWVLGDSGQLHQVLLNLAGNAVHAMDSKGGVLTLRIVNENPRSLTIYVEDTGTGIPEEHREAIFDPYFTTKPSDKGTGIGLAIARNIIHHHRGSITVSSSSDGGSSFRIELPLDSQGAHGFDLEKTRKIQKSGATKSLRVLVVDDEPFVLEITAEMIRYLGHDATITESAREAIELIRKDPGYFDLVISDQTMPDIRGTDLAEELSSVREDLPVIVCTGRPDDTGVVKASNAGRILSLTKPVSPGELNDAIIAILQK